MKIRELYIDGFGHFHDRHLGPFLSPIVVLHGPNEAGKTTLLAFIRTILFGFPTRNRDKHYPPLASGRHGGRLTVIDDAGKEYVIERFAGVRGGPVHIRDDSGSPQGEAVFTKMLGNDSQDIFTNVFAFSFEELQTGDLLEDAHINGQIYSAGLGAAKLPQALETLKARREAIFLSRGRKQIISDLMTELQEVDSQLDTMRGNAAEYGRRAARREDIDKALARMNAEQSTLLARRGEMSKLEEAWEDWIDLVGAEERLKDIPQLDGFPTDPIGRLENAEQQWLSDHTLPISLMPETMHEFIGLVEATRLEYDQVQGMRHRVAAIEVDIQEYQDLVQPLAHKYAIAVATENTRHMAIVADRLIERFEKARDEVAQRHTAQEEAEQARRRYERREKPLKEAEEELQGLLSAVGAESPKAFRLKAAQYAERMEFEKQRHESRSGALDRSNRIGYGKTTRGDVGRTPRKKAAGESWGNTTPMNIGSTVALST